MAAVLMSKNPDSACLWPPTQLEFLSYSSQTGRKRGNKHIYQETGARRCLYGGKAVENRRSCQNSPTVPASAPAKASRISFSTGRALPVPELRAGVHRLCILSLEVAQVRTLPAPARYVWVVLEGPPGSQEILAVCESFIDALDVVEEQECYVDPRHYREKLTPEDEESYFFYWVGTLNRDQNIAQLRRRKDEEDVGFADDVPWPSGTTEVRPVHFYRRSFDA